MRRQKLPPLYIGADDVQMVVTVSEAAKLAKVNRRTIMYHIIDDNLTARQTGKMWLISLKSLVVLYKLSHVNIDIQSADHQV